MRELFIKIFGEKPANEFTELSMFSWTHILYMVLIFGTVVAITYFFRKKELSVRKKVLDIVAILVGVCYILDFFLQPIYDGGTLTENANIILDKFPFHICIVLCPLILFSRFSKHGHKIQKSVSLLASLAPLMWIIYPGTALDADQSAFSYVVIQLFAYHGLVFIFGSLCLLLNVTKLDIKKCYEEAIWLIAIALWATFGNVLYSTESHSYNWFFLKNPVFDFIPKSINPIVVLVVFYLSSLLIYGIYYFVMYLNNERNLKELIIEDK